jgi:hypothetical protein
MLLDDLLSEIVAVVDNTVECAYQMSLEQAKATSDKPIQPKLPWLENLR